MLTDEQDWTAEDDNELSQDLAERYEHDDPPLALRSPPVTAGLLRERLRAMVAAGASGGDTPWGTLDFEDGRAVTEADIEELAREIGDGMDES